MSNIWCNRCHKILATPWCPDCDASELAIACDRIRELEARLAEANYLIETYKREHASLSEQLDRAIDDGIADTEEEKARRIAAEARESEQRATLEKVEAWMAIEDGPIYYLWENLDICDYDSGDCTWDETLDQVRDFNIPAESLGYGVEWPVVALYREILQVIKPAEQPDCGHPFRVGDVCPTCGAADAGSERDDAAN